MPFSFSAKRVYKVLTSKRLNLGFCGCEWSHNWLCEYLRLWTGIKPWSSMQHAAFVSWSTCLKIALYLCNTFTDCFLTYPKPFYVDRCSLTQRELGLLILLIFACNGEGKREDGIDNWWKLWKKICLPSVCPFARILEVNKKFSIAS